MFRHTCNGLSRSFIEALGINNLRVRMSGLLTPAAVWISSKHSEDPITNAKLQIRRFSSLDASELPWKNAAGGRFFSNPKIQRKIESLILSPRRQDPDAWVALLEPYLPIDLRLNKTDLVESMVGKESNRLIRNVLLIFEKARAGVPNSIDLLSYLGVFQKRWKVVMWLARAILSAHKECSETAEELERFNVAAWSDFGMSLDELTVAPVWADDIIQPVAPTNFCHEMLVQGDEYVELDTKKGIGQIWQGLGCMILQAADRLVNDPDGRLIMFNVFEILAYMHHVNAIPSSVYYYTQAKDPFVVQRPPTLTLLSSQILTILSDTAWRAQDLEILSKTNATETEEGCKNNDIRATSWQPHVRELDPSIWLDLVLWSCIEGGWIREAGWIATEIDSRKNKRLLSWSVMGWESVKKPKILKTSWSVMVEQIIANSRVNQIAGGIGIAGHGRQPPVVNIPSRTISREVIMALLDGLVTSARATDFGDQSGSTIHPYISTCKRLLATEGLGLHPHILNSIILRLVESEGVDVVRSPKTLEQILLMSPTHPSEVEFSMSTSLDNRSFHELGITTTAACLGLLHQALRSFVKLGNIQGALRIFRRAQSLRDENHKQLLYIFMEGVKKQHPTLADHSDIMEETKALIFHTQIPVYILSTFLDLVTNANLFEFGKWLLKSDDVDGPTIPQEMYSLLNLQPALLRFATATADSHLQFKVIDRMEAPLPPIILRALLHCQVALGKWDSAEALLTYLRDEAGKRWHPVDVMTIAKAILQLERESNKNPSCAKSISQAMTLLQKLLSGEYNSARTSSQDRALSEARMMNQLFRILKSCPGKISKLTSPYSHNTGRLNAPIEVKVHSFNILLSGVVESYGSSEGKKLWQCWCDEVGDDSLQKTRRLLIRSSPKEDLERVVRPNLQTLRTILRPIIQAGIDCQKRKNQGLQKGVLIESLMSQANGYWENQTTNSQDSKKSESIESREIAHIGYFATPKEERDILDWGLKLFKRFGLSREEIDIEIPLFLRRSKKQSYG